MPELLPLKSGYYIWKYIPSTALSAISAILWLVVAGLLAWRMFRTRTWFCSAFVIGCFMEFIGYCARAGAANKTDRLMPYIIQGAFTLLPPALFAATIYMCLGRIIVLVGGEEFSIVKPRLLTRVFVGGDVISFVIQGGSSGLMVMATTHPTLGKLGNGMVIAGLVIQLISFALFGLTAMLFHTRLRKSPTPLSYQVDQSWIKTMNMLYSVSVLIIIRSIFRIIEYVMGTDGYPLEHEWTLYVFDTIPMLIASAIVFFRYPSNITPRDLTDIQLESQQSGERILPNKRY